MEEAVTAATQEASEARVIYEGLDPAPQSFRQSYYAFFWSEIAMVVIISICFMIGGGIRYKILQDIGRVQQKKFSWLFICKMILYMLLIILDLAVVIICCIIAFMPVNDPLAQPIDAASGGELSQHPLK